MGEVAGWAISRYHTESHRAVGANSRLAAWEPNGVVTWAKSIAALIAGLIPNSTIAHIPATHTINREASSIATANAVASSIGAARVHARTQRGPGRRGRPGERAPRRRSPAGRGSPHPAPARGYSRTVSSLESEVRTSQPWSVTATRSSMRTPNLPGQVDAGLDRDDVAGHESSWQRWDRRGAS